MTHIPSADLPREVKGGARNTDTTAYDAAAGGQGAFAAAFQASLLGSLTSLTSNRLAVDAESRTFGAQSMRVAQRDESRLTAGEAGVHRLATVSELASRELATSTYTSAPAPVDDKVQTNAHPRARQDPQQKAPTSTQPARTQEPAQSKAETGEPRQARAESQSQGSPPTGASKASSLPVDAPTPRSAPAGVAVASPPSKGVAGVPAARGPVMAKIGATPVARRGSMPGVTRAQKPAQSPDLQRHAKTFQAQLARGLAAALKRAGDSITLNLRPRHLGRLTIELSVRDGLVDARIQATTDAARGLLESGGVELRESLASRGLTLQRLDIQVVEQEDDSQDERQEHAVHDQDADTPRDHEAERRDRRDGLHASREPVEDEPDDDVGVVALGVDVTV